MSAAPTSLASLSDALATLVATAASSIVAIHSHRSRSSGFVWKPGLIVTADEALADEGEVAVTLPGGERAPATTIGRDPTADVALLRIERADLVPVSMHPAAPSAGALVVAVGANDGGP